jgi:hypothetical protein
MRTLLEKCNVVPHNPATHRRLPQHRGESASQTRPGKTPPSQAASATG